MKFISYFLRDLKILMDEKNIIKPIPVPNKKNNFNKTTTEFYKSNTSEVLPKLGNELSYISECN